jgi:hypothetical protein
LLKVKGAAYASFLSLCWLMGALVAPWRKDVLGSCHLFRASHIHSSARESKYLCKMSYSGKFQLLGPPAASRNKRSTTFTL